MRLRRGIRLSVRALVTHKRRVTLATGSVALGVGAVLVSSALGQGMRDEVVRDIAKMGTNLIVVRPTQVEKRVARPSIRGQVTSLRLEDVVAVATLPDVAAVAPGRDQTVRLKAGRGSMNALLFGTTPAFFSLRGLRVESGRVFDWSEDLEASRVAVLGARVAGTLFPARNPVGTSIRVRGIPFEVVGVLEPRGVLADGSDEDGNIFVPARTALRRVFNSTWVTALFVRAAVPDRMEATEEAVRGALRARHRLASDVPDDFEIQNQAKLLSMRATLAESLSLLAAALAGASLFVGGTGVLALMLLSVKERTSEIGLRMAVGARARDVFVQFLMEASLLSLAGWVAGALAAGTAVGVLALLTEWPLGFPSRGVAATTIATAVAGIGFGALPARRAARLTPTHALQRR